MDPPFRFVTVDILLTLLQQILQKESRKLSSYESSLLKIAYVTACKNLEEIARTPEILQEFFPLFNEEWAVFYDFSSRRVRKHDQLLQDAALLWGMQDDPKVIISEFIRLPFSEHDTAKSYIKVFLSLKQAYGKIFKSEENEKFPFPEEIKENVPAGPLVVLSDSQKLVTCQQKIEKIMQTRYIIEDPIYFIMIELDYTWLQTAKLVKRVRLTELHFALDITEPRKLCIYIIKNSSKFKKEQPEEIILYFDDINMCSHIKKKLEESRAKIYKRQDEKLFKYFSEIKTKLKTTAIPYDNLKH